MEKKKFDVQIYFSGFCTYEIEAENREDAIFKAGKFEVNKEKLLSNIENWKEADTAIEIKNEEVKK